MNNFLTDLLVSGDPEHAEDARLFIEEAFQCRLREKPEFRFGDESPPVLAVLRMDPADFVPVEFVKELSRRRPNLAFKLLYWNGFGGFRGHVTYMAGEVTGADREEFVLEELPSCPVPLDEIPCYEEMYDVDLCKPPSGESKQARREALVAHAKAALEAQLNWVAMNRPAHGQPEAST